MSGPIRPASRYDKCPVRMLPVQVAVFIHHLRFDPDTEFQSHPIDLLDQLTQAAPQLFLIDFPVAESSQLTVSLAEPSVIHDEHLDPELCGLLRQFQKRLPGEIKIGRLPAVEQNRTHCFLVFAPAQMSADTPMQVLGQFCQTFGGITHNHFR